MHPCARSWVQPNGRRLALHALACHRQGCSSSPCSSFSADSACTQLRQPPSALACGRCTVLPLRHECMADSECILSAACVALQVRRNNWKYQSGLLPESQGAGALPAASWQRAPHAVRLCLRPSAWLYLPCRPVAVCRNRVRLIGNEPAAHFSLENGVLE